MLLSTGDIPTCNYVLNPVLSILKILFLRWYCTPNLKLACFVCYFKIINTFWESNACILK